jgi:hypothetical protein
MYLGTYIVDVLIANKCWTAVRSNFNFPTILVLRTHVRGCFILSKTLRPVVLCRSGVRDWSRLNEETRGLEKL